LGRGNNTAKVRKDVWPLDIPAGFEVSKMLGFSDGAFSLLPGCSSVSVRVLGSTAVCSTFGAATDSTGSLSSTLTVGASLDVMQSTGLLQVSSRGFFGSGSSVSSVPSKTLLVVNPSEAGLALDSF